MDTKIYRSLLAEVSFAVLVYLFLYDGLDRVKRDKTIRAQIEYLAATKIAYEIIGKSKPPPYNSMVGEHHCQQWVVDVNLLELLTIITSKCSAQQLG